MNTGKFLTISADEYHAHPLTKHLQNARNSYKTRFPMKYTYIFPSILIALDVLSAIAYGFSKDWRQVIYWLAAATLSACVTYR